MRVLIPFDIEGISPSNRFLPELVNSIEHYNCTVGCGLFRLKQKLDKWDVVNIHWPEYMIKRNNINQTDINNLEKLLKQISKSCVIVLTVHNIRPHHSSIWDEKIYGLTYKYADGLIHLGKESIKIFKQANIHKPYRVIPHGNYDSLEEYESDYKEIIINKKPIIITTGMIRSYEEVNLLLKVSNIIKNLDTTFNCYIRLRIASKQLARENIIKFIIHLIQQIFSYLRLKLNRNLRFKDGYISDSNLVELIKRADILFIPRINSINSGNVALGFTFGAITIAPDYGNIGTILKDHANPTFSIEFENASIHDAFRKGIQMAKEGKGKENKIIAKELWNWRKIGKEYISFFEELLQKKYPNK